MSVYRNKDRRTFQYKFRYAGRVHKGNTFQEDEERAKLVEAKKKLELRERRGGIALPAVAPTFSAWSGVYFGWCEKMQGRTGRPKRLDRIEEQIQVVLRFWGSRPTDPRRQPKPGEEAPFHNVTLRDPIEDPSWILRWDDWLDRRHLAGSTRNHYNTTVTRLYHVAMLPEYRMATGVLFNPFAGRPRAPRAKRKVALTPDLVQQWLEAMSYHARLAVAIAALAPKLRLRNVLALEWGKHIDPALQRIVVDDHKSDRITGEPLVSPISAQLREILVDARARTPRATHVVTYHGKPIDSVRGAVAAAARQAQIPYGLFTPGGVTFHSLRHTASTLFARLGVNPWLHRDALGHQDLQTSDGYTHLLIEEQRPALEQLSAALPIAAIVTRPGRRASRKSPGATTGGPDVAARQKAQETNGHGARFRRTPGRPFVRKAQ